MSMHWENNIQDTGCLEVDLPQKRYKKAKMISLGPKDGEKLGHFHLIVLAVDYVKAMQKQRKSNI